MKTILTYLIALTFGILFALVHIPLPFILGPVVGLFLYKIFIDKEMEQWSGGKNIAYLVLGVQIGLTFTSKTFSVIGPYFFPYTLLSVTMIAISMAVAYWIARQTKLDTTTSLIGAAPGGLSAMIAVSESFQGRTVLVTIFHTLRLVAVLFVVPLIATHWFTGSSAVNVDEAVNNGPIWTLLVYVLLLLVAYKLRSLIPAALVIIPMLVVGGFQAYGLSLYQWPNYVFIAAQVLIGVHLGTSVSMEDVKAAGKYSFLFAGLSLLMIGIGCLFGLLLSVWTGMGVLTALLALAPGGLVEMALTAQQTGAEPSVVSSLQTIRLLTIVLILPMIFRWWLPKVK
ncbi:AbrB family transcriptional regulator [Halobacillus salinus]|uniref:AbrB family transcriptional regulator n=1 Tax=Halobacillus salinus TaxID=192814 RepID=UPI0020CA8DF2|nr:AbrB family transcriptional regulator [Halobacillus salinus]